MCRKCFATRSSSESCTREVLPHLLQRRHSLKVWSAGCSYGAEAYSIAGLLHEARRPTAGIRFSAPTSIPMCWSAQRESSRPAMCAMCPRSISSATSGCSKRSGRTLYEADPILKRYLRFQKHNLLSDPYPQGFDLIACCICDYLFLGRGEGTHLPGVLPCAHAGGYLFLGNTERIFHYQQIGYENPFAFYYRKPEQEVQRWRNAS